MATKTVQMWYLSDKDKEEIKSYSKKITVLCKLKVYKPGLWIDNIISPDDLSFIPCIKEWIDFEKPKSFVRHQDIVNAINSAYDSSVELSLQDLKEMEKYEQAVKETLEEMIIKKDKDTVGDFIDFVFTCSDDVKQKFINWIVD